MKNLESFVSVFTLAAILFCTAAAADAQATRTWVSGVGDDANPCSRTAPCKTFASAISKTATGGEINCLDPGGFGTVTLTKSVRIDCRGTLGSILASGTTGVIINGSTAVVSLRGLNINGAGTGINGIRVISAARVNIEETVIDGFTSNGVSVENSADIKVMIDRSTLRNNTAAGVSGLPVGSADIAVSNTSLTGNGTAIAAGPNATFRISGNMIFHNTTGLSALAKGKIISFNNNAIDGNGTNGAATSTMTLH